MSKGIVILAQNSEGHDYIRMAYALALSIDLSQPIKTPVTLITNDPVPREYAKVFDKVLEIPWGDASESSRFKVENRWKIYHASPYDETIVMDTDMLVLQNIDIWWKFLSNYEMFFVNRVLNYRGEIANTSYYRKTFIKNKLREHLNPYPLCSIMNVDTYEEGLDLLIKILGKPSDNPEDWAKIEKPLTMWREITIQIRKEVKEKGCEEKNLTKIKETFIREHETRIKENQFWLGTISGNAQNQENIIELTKYNEWVNSLKADDIKVFANKYLKTDNYARFILNPESK